MLSAPPSIVAVADLCTAITAVVLFSFLDLQSGSGTTTSTSTHPPPLDSAVQVLLPLAATVTLFTSVASIYRHLHRAAAAAAGSGNRRLLELVIFLMSAAVGLLEFFLFVQPAGGVDLGMAAVDALPAAATVTFFLGMTLIIVHIRAGGEGGGGAVYDNRPVPAPVELLKKMALGAAAALVSQMAMALYAKL